MGLKKRRDFLLKSPNISKPNKMTIVVFQLLSIAVFLLQIQCHLAYTYKNTTQRALRCLNCVYPMRSRPDDTSCLDVNPELSITCPIDATYCSKTELKSPDGKTAITRRCVSETQTLKTHRDTLGTCVDVQTARMCTCRTDNCNLARGLFQRWSSTELCAISFVIIITHYNV